MVGPYPQLSCQVLCTVSVVVSSLSSRPRGQSYWFVVRSGGVSGLFVGGGGSISRPFPNSEIQEDRDETSDRS